MIEAEFPGIDPVVLEAMLPELKACISHKCKNTRYCSKRYEVLMCTCLRRQRACSLQSCQRPVWACDHSVLLAVCIL